MSLAAAIEAGETNRRSRRPMARDAIACLSLANVSFLRVWTETLAFRKSDALFAEMVPDPRDYIATMIDVVVLAGVFFLIVSACRRYLSFRAYRVARIGFLGFLVFPLAAIRGALARLYPILKSPLLQFVGLRTLVIAVPLCLVLLWFVWKYQPLVAKLSVAAAIATFPFCVLTFGEAVWNSVTYSPPRLEDRPLASRLPAGKANPRIVWMIFDEWDYRLTFTERARDLSMPAVDRFRSESIFATRAHSPSMATESSLPALLTGRAVRLLNPAPFQYSVEEPEEFRRTPWATVPTVFAAARRDGANTALIGWYLPYCSMLNSVLTDCGSWPLPVQANSTGETLGETVIGQMRSLFETDSFSIFGQSSALRHAIRNYSAYMEQARRVVQDEGIGFVFLHVPVPHAPHFYNRYSGRFDGRNNPIRGYLNSLALMDRTFGELRELMEKRGLWSNSAVLISADHPFRASAALDGKFDPRVPFLLKLPGQTTAATYGDRVNTIVSARLVLEILEGRIATTGDALAWLKQHGQDTEAAVPGS